MSSPFPGMDPYLEGYLWPDVHHSLATEIRKQLIPRLRPPYVARIEIQVVQDESPNAEIGIMYPDVEIVTASRHASLPLPPMMPAGGGVAVAEAPSFVTMPLTIPLSKPRVRLKTVEIRDTAQNKLITSIELLSPVNKREPGLTKYRDKRKRLIKAGLHFLEIDFLRRGKRPFTHPRIPKVTYQITLTRSKANVASVWPIKLEEKLPAVPVPLRAPDPDVLLDLGAVLKNIYDEAPYELSIDYTMPPPPPSLTEEQEKWLAGIVSG
jgi:hypothetical protein